MLGNTPVQRTNLNLERAKSFALQLAFVDANGKSVDLTGCTSTLTVDQPQHMGGGDVLDVVGEINGNRVLFKMQAADLDMPSAAYPYDSTLVNADGYSIPIVKGELILGENSSEDTTNTYSEFNPSQELRVTLQTNWAEQPLTGANCVRVTLNTVPGIQGDPGPEGPQGPPGGVFIQPDQPGDPGSEPPHFPLWVDTDEDVLAPGLPAGGTTGQVLGKLSDADGDADWINQSGGGGTGDHGSLNGLSDDDHTQYGLVITSTQEPENPRVGTVWVNPYSPEDPYPDYMRPVDLVGGTEIDVDSSSQPGKAIINSTYRPEVREAPMDDLPYGREGGNWIRVEAFGSVSAHEAEPDPHNQYHNDTRGDARYYTQAQLDPVLAGKVNQDSSYAVAIETIMRLSQAEYDALGAPSDSVLYVIVG